MSVELAQALRLLEGVQRLAVLTGAGMSQESGIPTFRDALTGLWARFDPEELATEAAFRRHPARVFGWYVDRWRQIRDARPHPGYRAITALAARFPDASVVTQNVDGLHRRAGNPDVIELHGALDRFRCLDGGHPFDTGRVERWAVGRVEEIDPPLCPECSSPIRPGVVWFGEILPPSAVTRAWRAVERCEVLLVVGTSAEVYPAAELPAVAVAHGGRVIEINPDPTPLTPRADLRWSAPAGVALPALAGALIPSGVA